MKFDPRLLAKMLLGITADTEAQQMAEALMSKFEAIAIEECKNHEEAEKLITGSLTDYEVSEIFETRAERLAHMEAIDRDVELLRPLWESATPCDDDSFDHAVEQGGLPDTPLLMEAYGGFESAVGVNEHGTVTIYIRNNLKGHTNLIFTIPFTPEEWAAKKEGSK
jgi:hypothetical protein